MDLTTIAIFLPFFNAIFYGLYYAFLQEVLGSLSLATILLVNGALSILTSLAMCLLRLDGLSFVALEERRIMVVFIGLIIISIILSATHYAALKNTSATYAAFAEISYPLFVALFTYLLFSRGELTSSIALGGGLIFLGSLVIVRSTIN
jgi:drug/metabolite transporter (DMT)-like permease